MGLPDQFQDAEDRAVIYRNDTEARITYRGNQMRRLAGSWASFERLWGSVRPIFDKTNYIRPPASTEGPNTLLDDGSYMTPYDIDCNGAISSSPVRVPNARHASDQNDRPYGAS